MKPKFLFVYPTKYYYKNVFPERMKSPILSLMTHIIDLADVDFIDFEMLYKYPVTPAEIGEFKDLVRSKLKNYNPDIIGISCYTSFDYLSTVDIIHICHELHPKAKIVVGGFHPTAVPEDFDELPVDFVIRGEGELALREIIETGGKGLTKVILGKPLPPEFEKPLRYDIYPNITNELTLPLSRGCFHKCDFCVQSDDYLNNYRKDNLEHIKEKIKRAAEALPLRKIMFTDSYFGVNAEYTIKLIEFLKEEYSNLEYWCETRIDNKDMSWIPYIKDLKFDLHFGVESLANDTLLNLMHKTKNPDHYIESFFKTVELCQKNRLLALYGFIMNYPGELAESYEQTVSNIKKAALKYDEIDFYFHSNQYALYPGNNLYKRRFELAQNRGFYFGNDGWWRVHAPDVRARSENCIASTSIANKYGRNNAFWRQDNAVMKALYAKKHTYKAYARFHLEDITVSIADHYNKPRIPENDLTYENQYELLKKYKYTAKKHYYLYEDWLKIYHPEFCEYFSKLYNYLTYQYQRQLLTEYDNGLEFNMALKKLDDFYMLMEKEYEENTSEPQKDLSTLSLKLLGGHYIFNTDGTVKQLITQKTANTGS